MKRKLIGNVGVDSGQLMIIDPCYISDEWVEEDGANIIGMKFWGQGQDEMAEFLINSGHDYITKENHVYKVKSDDDGYLRSVAKVIKEYSEKIGKIVLFSAITDSTYDTICDLTCSEDQAGQLNYAMGHDGLAVAFSSGLGDGVYNVYATYKDMGNWGERITKVEIELIEDDEQ
jgi:hypothetical protein